MVKRSVKFETLGSTFILRIFVDKDWAPLFGKFHNPIKELIKEFYSNAWFTRAELKCWVQRKDFIITLDYLAKILQMNRLVNADTTPYNDRFGPLDPILSTLGTNLKVSSTKLSIGTTKFSPEVKIFRLIMYSNIYPLTNTGFINIGRAGFLDDLINGTPIDIYAHSFPILGKIAGRSVPRTCLPFCSLIMKILLLKGVHLPSVGTILPHQGLISMPSLKRKFHSPVERAKKKTTQPPKNESKSFILVAFGGHPTATPSFSH